MREGPVRPRKRSASAEAARSVISPRGVALHVEMCGSADPARRAWLDTAPLGSSASADAAPSIILPRSVALLGRNVLIRPCK